MIKVDVTKSTIHYQSLKVTGHAYSDEPGKDLVCAAVSALSQTLVNAVEIVGEIPEKNLKVVVKNGYLEIEVRENDLSDVIDIIFRTFMIGIEGIEDTYPKYVKLRIKEVQEDV